MKKITLCLSLFLSIPALAQWGYHPRGYSPSSTSVRPSNTPLDYCLIARYCSGTTPFSCRINVDHCSVDIPKTRQLSKVHQAMLDAGYTRLGAVTEDDSSVVYIHASDAYRKSQETFCLLRESHHGERGFSLTCNDDPRVFTFIPEKLGVLKRDNILSNRGLKKIHTPNLESEMDTWYRVEN